MRRANPCDRAERQTALLVGLAAASEAILRASSRDEVCQQVCDAVAGCEQVTGIALLFIGSETSSPQFVAGSGEAIEHLRTQAMNLNGGTDSTAAIALRTQRIHTAILECNRSGAALPFVEVAAPLLHKHDVVGIVLLCIRDQDLLDDQIISFLERTAANLAFVLERLDRKMGTDDSSRAIRRLARMYSTASAVNEAILRAKSAEELLQLASDAAVTHARSLACAQLLCDADGDFRVVGDTGDVCRLLKQTRFSADPENEFGNGPWATAFQSRRTAIADTFLDLEQGGVQPGSDPTPRVVCVATPLVCYGGCVGVSIYLISKRWLADKEVVALIERSVANIGFGLERFDQEAKRKQAESRLEFLATHDALTGLANRVQLGAQIENTLHRSARGELVAIHLLDLDRFKGVNDTLGHPVGDKLLVLVAHRLRESVRGTDVVARLGGDEFAIVQAIDHASQASLLAMRIVEALRAPFVIGEHTVAIGTSIGIAIAPTDGTTPEELLRHADVALYRAKDSGRNDHRFYEPLMDAEARQRREVELDLRHAIAAGEFELFYQPLIGLANGQVVGVEALARWRHPQKGLLPPKAFIPVAEKTGLILPLGKWIIRAACAAAANWPPHIRVSVNLSPVQLKAGDLVRTVAEALTISQLPAERLELEITETVFFGDCEATLSTLYDLRALGVRVSIDNFGTGSSLLSQLQSFPFGSIKIDRSFVADINQSTASLNIVRAISSLASGLGIATTAEGVETIEQLEAVKSEGCTDVQGFLFSQPLPRREIDQLLLSTPHNRRMRESPNAAA